jgi:hypothetical protein
MYSHVSLLDIDMCPTLDTSSIISVGASVVKIASQLADSDEFTIYPSLTERNRAQNRRRRESAPDRRSGSQNRGNAVRSDSKRVSRERRRLELNAPFCFLLKHTVLYFIKTHCFLF